MVNEIKKKKDSDLPGILIGCGVFILGLIIVDCTYSRINDLLSSWLVWPFIVGHIGILFFSIVVIAKIADPKYDKYRRVLIFITITTLLLVIGHRSGFVSDKMFQEDVNKIKIENAN